MTTGLTPSLTLEEFLKLPETKPVSEFFAGQIHQKPMPQGKHSCLNSSFVILLIKLQKPHKLP
jgi:Uma2 family endonuclease